MHQQNLHQDATSPLGRRLRPGRPDITEIFVLFLWGEEMGIVRIWGFLRNFWDAPDGTSESVQNPEIGSRGR